uniref:Reverse transcriptase domain-containing protein n=1 Tax=Leptobrachium leishanense TaxID=445787 RepID=A0A8C5MTA5_9ANUR
MTWSDHHPVLLTLASPLVRPKDRTWRLNETLLNDPIVTQGTLQTLQNYFTDNSSPDTSPQIIWEAHKAVIRGYLIQQGSLKKKQYNTQRDALLCRIQVLEKSHKLYMDDTVYAELLELRTELSSLLNKTAQKAFLTTRRVYYEHGNKCGRLLARALKAHREKLYISKLRNPQGKPVTLPQDMLSLLREHFTELYNLPTDHRPSSSDSICKFVDMHTHTKLTPLMREALDSPLTVEELQNAVKLTPTGKTPGPDGLSLRYYKTFLPTLAPAWLQAFNTLTQHHRVLPPQSLSATITLIPKPDKDHDLCASFRPISLLNQDLKLFAKALALRIARHIPHLVHPDQTGFIPGREARDNTVRALNLIHVAAKSRSDPSLLLSTDAEKAFDRVSWPYLFSTLRQMGFGSNMLAWIGSLYADPTARINLNGTLTTPFHIRNGTRQGCPLSPLLFAISLEPLLHAIRTNPSIHGIEVAGHRHKVATYADDLLFFIRQPLISLPALTSLLREYGSLSNYKINMTKSEILGLSVPPPMRAQLQASFPFRWCKSSLKYLGIFLTADTSDLYQANYLPLLHSITADLTKWAFPHVTWFGRINVLKMNILPRLLYLFQTLPIAVPTLFFRSLQSKFTTFVWNNHRPRLRFELLTASKSAGGLALPHARRYYQAAHLLRILEWTSGADTKLWIPLERTLADAPLASLPWLNGTNATCRVTHHPTISATLRTWRTLQNSTKIAPRPSPLLPLCYLPAFSRRLITTEQMQAPHCIRASNFIDGNTFKSPEDIPLPWPQSFLTKFHFHRLTAYMRSLAPPPQFTRPLTLFETLAQRKHPPPHGISVMYGLLQSLTNPIPSYRSKWEEDLQLSFTEEEWDQITLLTTSCSIATKSQETAYKLLSRWYCPPKRLAMFDPKHNGSCWKCRAPQADLLHMWWSCPLLQPYWQAVHSTICKVSEPPPDFTPAAMLLLHTPMEHTDYKRTLEIRLLNAAKAVLPRHWKTPNVPTIREWLQEVHNTQDIEELIHSASGTSAVHLRRWFYWSEARPRV